MQIFAALQNFFLYSNIKKKKIEVSVSKAKNIVLKPH